MTKYLKLAENYQAKKEKLKQGFLSKLTKEKDARDKRINVIEDTVKELQEEEVVVNNEINEITSIIKTL